ncbi:MAG: hypothetical protein Q9216_003313 [Gyalolechia sp. 2 TL-2023]
MNLVMTMQQGARRLPSVLTQYDLNNQNPTLERLSNLHRALDRECVHRSSRAGRPDPNLAYGTIVQFTVYLSSQLLLCDGPHSDIFRETQLRALVAAFALLLHTEITQLAPPRYDELRGNIAGRFSDIVNIPTPDLQSRMRKANASFLIRLAAQYFSLIKRAEPVPDVLVPSILGLVLVGASVASGQYTGLHRVFRYADHIIGTIPGRGSQYLNLPALQEITRRATTLLEEADVAIEDSGKRKAIEAAANDVKLVQDLLKTYLQEIPSRRRGSWNWPLTQLGLGPPALDKWHFFYGLLDCAAQLVRWLRPEQISIELLRTFTNISEESEFEEFRWKIVEISLVCSQARTGSIPFRETSRRLLGLDEAPEVSEFEVEAMTRIVEEGVIYSAGDWIPAPDRMTETSSLNCTEQQRLEITPAAASEHSEMDSSERTSGQSMRRASTGNTSTTADRIDSCPLGNGPTDLGCTNKQEDFLSLIEIQLTRLQR